METENPINANITQQRQNSPEHEREIYEKWLKKCQEDASYSRQASEQNNFERIKFGREVLNRIGQIPDPEKTKLYTPYMQYSTDGNQNHNNALNKSRSYNKKNIKLETENEYELYTIDGFPRKNFLKFYENGYGITRGGSDITNLEKYNQVFMESLNVDESALEGLKYQSIDEWDSVGHMGLVAGLEDAFDIMMETDDIIDLSSYEKGKEILSQKYEISF